MNEAGLYEKQPSQEKTEISLEMILDRVKILEDNQSRIYESLSKEIAHRFYLLEKHEREKDQTIGTGFNMLNSIVSSHSIYNEKILLYLEKNLNLNSKDFIEEVRKETERMMLEQQKQIEEYVKTVKEKMQAQTAEVNTETSDLTEL